MTIFLSKKPNLANDDSNYKNLSSSIVMLKKCTDEKVNAILLLDSTRINLSKDFSEHLDFLTSFLSEDNLENHDCHDIVYMLAGGIKRNTSGPLSSKELKSIGFRYIGDIKIDAGNDSILGSMNRIFARDRLVKDGKLSVNFDIKEKNKENFTFKPGDIITFSFIMNGGHSMTYLGKNEGKDLFLSKLGIGQLSIHSIEEIYEYYGLTEALIFRK